MKKPEVFIERASPLTKSGIRSLSCSEEEYKWYCKGLEDRKKQHLQEELEFLEGILRHDIGRSAYNFIMVKVEHIKSELWKLSGELNIEENENKKTD